MVDLTAEAIGIIKIYWAELNSSLKRSSDLRWRIRFVVAAMVAASISLMFEKNLTLLCVFSLLVVVSCFFYEVLLIRSEDNIRRKTQDVEKQLNSIVEGKVEVAIRNHQKINTAYKGRDYKEQLFTMTRRHQVQFWGPYLGTVVILIIALMIKHWESLSKLFCSCLK